MNKEIETSNLNTEILDSMPIHKNFYIFCNNYAILTQTEVTMYMWKDLISYWAGYHFPNFLLQMTSPGTLLFSWGRYVSHYR